MANELVTVWVSTQATKEQAHLLANTINQGLAHDNQLIVIGMSTNWYIIAGTETAKKFYDEFAAVLAEDQEKKKALQNSLVRPNST